MPTKKSFSIVGQFSESEIKEIKNYFNEMRTKEILIGLKFARNRWNAKDSGILKVGQKKFNTERNSLSNFWAGNLEIKELEDDDCKLP